MLGPGYMLARSSYTPLTHMCRLIPKDKYFLVPSQVPVPASDDMYTRCLSHLPEHTFASKHKHSHVACVAGEAAAIRLEARLRGSSAFMDAVEDGVK